MKFCNKCGGLLPTNEPYNMVGVYPCRCTSPATAQPNLTFTYQTVSIQSILDLNHRINHLEGVVENLANIIDQLLNKLSGDHK